MFVLGGLSDDNTAVAARSRFRLARALAGGVREQSSSAVSASSAVERSLMRHQASKALN